MLTENNPKNQHRDIVSFRHGEPMSMTRFRKKQELLIDAGYKFAMDEMQDKCPECGELRLDIYYDKGKIHFAFMICLTCWTACDVIPEYEDDPVSKDDIDNQLTELIPMLDAGQVELFLEALKIILA